MAKKKEESSRKKKPKVLNVPINLSDQEIGQLRNKILLGLKQELIGGGSNEALADNDVLLPPTLPNPRVEFPRKASSDQNPADFKGSNDEGIITSCFVCFDRRVGYPLL